MTTSSPALAGPVSAAVPQAARASSAPAVSATPLADEARGYARAARYLMHGGVHPREALPGETDEAYLRGVARGFELAALKLLERARATAALAAKAVP